MPLPSADNDVISYLIAPHQLLRDGGNAGDAAQEDEGGHHRQHHAHDPGGDAQRLLEGVADGVGLDHVAGEAQGEDDSQREEAR